MGSPISVLAYVLWNIKVSGKAALMVDMSVRYDEYPGEGTEFSGMRDSMYILCVMNQCKLHHILLWLVRVAKTRSRLAEE